MTSYTRRYIREVGIDDAVIEVNARTERNRVRKHNKRARKNGLIGELASAEWLLLLAAHRFRCVYCGHPYETLDHIVPIANGGSTIITNVAPCCRACNEAKGATVWLPAECGG